jgi:catalase-peroxidase
MGMTDLETVALIAGGHTFGKTHGAADPSKYVGAEPEGAPVEEMGLGWKNSYKSGKGRDTITSGLEGAWTAKPVEWDHGYFENLFKYEWVQTKSPGGATQWIPSDESMNANKGKAAVANVPDAHDTNVKHLPIMFTTDLALRYDSIYGPISKRFHDNPNVFKDEFKRAWYKLCHRDMGPKARHLGPWVPAEDLIWMDPIPLSTYGMIDNNDIQELKSKIFDLLHTNAVMISGLVKVAWGAASTYRCTDHRGGANGGRIRLEPQRSWPVNDPPTLATVLTALEGVQRLFNGSNNKEVSIADLVVLGGCVAVEEAARQAGYGDVKLPFVPGRTDASQSQTDVESFNVLEPTIDGFRNYENAGDCAVSPEAALLDRAHLLSLTAPEMVVLIGGLRVLNANAENTNVGVLTNRPGSLTNDFFINLLDMSTTWAPLDGGKLYKGSSASKSWVASRVDLMLGSNSQLRAISEVYACSDSMEHFIKDFVNAWTKVCMLDRFDLRSTVVVEPRSKL